MQIDAIEYAQTSIGRKLRTMREERGLSQSEVAMRAHMRPEVLCRLENGKGNPTVATIRRIVKAIQG
jgi:transcriptional regulator with XRE-family HTH domain